MRVPDQHRPKVFWKMTLPNAETVSFAPLGIPNLVPMLMQASAAVPLGTQDGTETQNCLLIGAGKARQIWLFVTVTLMHSAV